MSHGGALQRAVQQSDRRTPLTGSGLPLVADLLAWNPTLLTYIWTWSLPSICLPSTLPAPQFRSSLAPPDARRAARLSSAAAPTRRPRHRPPRPGPRPYRLTLFRRCDRPRHRSRPTGHRSLGSTSQLEHFPSGPRLCRKPTGPGRLRGCGPCNRLRA
jgi:hypothetical protein